MQRPLFLLSLVALAALLWLSLLGSEAQVVSPSTHASTHAATQADRQAAPPSAALPKALETVPADRVQATRAADSTLFAKAAEVEYEYEALVTVSPKDQPAEPIADFDFEIVQARPFGMNRWRTVRVLGYGKTGHDGRAALRFCGPEFLHYKIRNAQPLAERWGFCVRLCEPGYQERFVPLYRTDPSANSSTFTATIEARPGGTARGRLVNSDGEGMRGQVMFVRTAEINSKGSPKTAGRRETDPDGRFLLHVDATLVKDPSGTLQGACMAWSEGLGTGRIADLSWPIDDLPQDLEITVRGRGALRGIVRDPDGGPSAGLDLILARVDVMAPGVKAHFIGTPAAPFLVDDGLFSAWVRTDAEGRFEATGLSPAMYAVHLVRGHPHNRDSSITLTDEPVFADGSEVEWTHGASGLVVQLQDASGTPWPGGLSLVDRRINKLTLPSAWSNRPAVLAYPAERRAGAWVCASSDPGSRCTARSLDGGAVQIVTGGARDLLVCVIGGNGQDGVFCGPPVHVAMEAGITSFPPLTIRAQGEAQAPPLGTLIVDAKVMNAAPARPPMVVMPGGSDPAVDPAGDPAECSSVPYLATAATRLVIEHGATGMPMFEADQSFAATPYRFALPPGTYTARAKNDFWRRGSGGGTGPIAYGNRSAVVTPGETTTMDLALDGGQTLTLQVKTEGARSSTGDQGPWVRLRMEYEDGRTVPIHHLVHRSAGSSFDWPTSYSDTWGTGDIHSTVPLPVGRGRIRGQVTGTRREIDVSVDIVHGHTLKLTL